MCVRVRESVHALQFACVAAFSADTCLCVCVFEQFIQNMEQDATETFQLTIPSHAMQYLSALICYLKQNLLQFLHPPNYLEESPDCHFQVPYISYINRYFTIYIRSVFHKNCV